MTTTKSHDTIYEASSACRQVLESCLTIAPLMIDEWPRRRLADFNLWASGSGALAKESASLDERLALRANTHRIVLDLLSLLYALIDDCRQLATASNSNDDLDPPLLETSSQDTSDIHIEERSLTDAKDDVEAILDQLVRISIAIRRSGTQARLERADKTFIPDRHQELKDLLSLLVFANNLTREDKIDANINMDVTALTLSPIQERLIEANLRRRHRFLFAHRRWTKSSREREPMSRNIILADRSDRLTEPNYSVNASLRTPTKALEPSAENPAPTITSTAPTTLVEPIEISPNSQPSMTAVSSTSLKVIYPKPPEVLQGQNLFRCPCCYQSLPIAVTAKRNWSKHLSGDLLPYTCILEQCPLPQKLYRTRREWLDHMQTEHTGSHYWLCFACSEPVKFDEENDFSFHLQSQHSDAVSIDQVPFFISECLCTGPVSLDRCPLCPILNEQEIEPEGLLLHIAEHLHSFSLNALPWQVPGEKEAEYLGQEILEAQASVYFTVESNTIGSSQTRSSLSEAIHQEVLKDKLLSLDINDFDDKSFDNKNFDDKDFDDKNFEDVFRKRYGADVFRKRYGEGSILSNMEPESSPSSGDKNTLDNKVSLSDTSRINPAYTQLHDPPVETGLFNNARTWIGRQINNTSVVEEIVRRSISRSEFKYFMQAWRWAAPSSDFIRSDDIFRLLNELVPPFRIRIYDGHDTVSQILEQSKHFRHHWNGDVDLARLVQRVSLIDVDKARQNRQRLCLLWHELQLLANDNMISRDNTLIVLSHYCLRDVGLKLENQATRAARLEKAVANAGLERIRGFFDMLYWSRRFQKHMAAKRAAAISAAVSINEKDK